jgi:hypothetical protein
MGASIDQFEIYIDPSHSSNVTNAFGEVGLTTNPISLTSGAAFPYLTSGRVETSDGGPYRLRGARDFLRNVSLTTLFLAAPIMEAVAKTVVLAISTLAAAFAVAPPVRVMATITEQAICVTVSAGADVATCGATGALTTDR